MSILRILSLAVLVAMPVAGASEPVAIVYSLTGEASLAAPAVRPLRLFDRLPSKAAVEVGPGSRLALAFTSGLRYEMGEGSQATLGTADFASRSGPIHPLSRVPPLPRLAPIAEGDRPGPRAGAVRIRGEEIGCLSPRDGAATLAGATVLRFQAVAGAAHHEVEIEDVRGNVIFHTVTEISAVGIPAGLLSPGTRYHWTVKAMDKPGPVVRGEADFVTISRQAAEAREKLRQAVEAADDGRALLEAVDHGLGMSGEECSQGAVVESVKPGSPGEASGLQPGDVLLSWSCPASLPAFPQSASGNIRSPYDLLPLEIEEAPRRAVTLRGKRGDQERVWTLTAGEWGIETRPGLEGDLAALYLEGKTKSEGDDLAAAEGIWRSAAESARTAGDGRLAAWFLDRLARTLAAAGKWPEADAAYEETLAALERESEALAAARLLRGWGKTFETRSAWDAAAERYQKALAFDRMAAPKSLSEARTLNELGITTAKRGDLSTAEEFLGQALTIREELAPGTVEVTGSLNNLGILARLRGDLNAAEDYLTRGENLQRRIAPNSADHALSFQNLGNLAANRGDLESAEAFHRQALAIFEKVAPGGDGVADCLQNIANIVMQRGDLAAADDLLRRSLALQEGRAPDELGISEVLVSLGNVASRRGELDAAEAYYRRALKIQEILSPNGREASASLANLGTVVALKGDHATARAYLRRSLEIKEALAPGLLSSAETLDELARLEMQDGGDLTTAESLLRQALVILEKQAPNCVDYAELLRHLGEVAARRGHFAEAIALHRRSLDLQRKLAPETTAEAETLYALGRAESLAGRREEGIRDSCRAIDVLDSQRGRIGGTQEARSSFEAAIGDYYQTCLEGLIQLGRPAEAFEVLERGRARSFLTLLAERDLRLFGLSPELDRQRRQSYANYDRAQSQLATLSAGRDDVEIERLTGELHDLRARQEEIITRIRRESPRSALVEYPETLNMEGVRAALDPGTVFLEYAVGAEATWLFVVQPAGAGVSVYRIPISAKALREEVEGFRRLLERPGSNRSESRSRGRRLYGLLVRPAEGKIADAKRVLVSPDGPLRTFPFAALCRRNRYLVEWKPIHSVLSGTVYAELTRSRPVRRNSEQPLAAFGDPVYPKSAPNSADPGIHEAVERGLNLEPIPASRTEVESIAALYPQSRVFLGRDATEEQVKSTAPGARLVHFACHGLLDERFPLNSALALTIPEHPEEGQDNGLLQAWEIFEGLRLDADLVTLSACDSGLGKEMGGEGLVGLVRAFQYAGARSVLASQWGVADDATADLMKRFYGYLRAGRSMDEALRAAQADLIRSKAFSHPYYWAAFQLTGDWK